MISRLVIEIKFIFLIVLMVFSAVDEAKADYRVVEAYPLPQELLSSCQLLFAMSTASSAAQIGAEISAQRLFDCEAANCPRHVKDELYDSSENNREYASFQRARLNIAALQYFSSEVVVNAPISSMARFIFEYEDPKDIPDHSVSFWGELASKSRIEIDYVDSPLKVSWINNFSTLQPIHINQGGGDAQVFIAIDASPPMKFGFVGRVSELCNYIDLHEGVLATVALRVNLKNADHGSGSILVYVTLGEGGKRETSFDYREFLRDEFSSIFDIGADPFIFCNSSDHPDDIQTELRRNLRAALNEGSDWPSFEELYISSEVAFVSSEDGKDNFLKAEIKWLNNHIGTLNYRAGEWWPHVKVSSVEINGKLVNCLGE